jgi:hypothetical protein
VPDYINFTAGSLEIGLVFRIHPEDKDYLLREIKNIFSSSLQLLTDLHSY